LARVLLSRPDTRRHEIAVAIDRVADEAHKFGAFLFGEIRQGHWVVDQRLNLEPKNARSAL